MNGTDLRHAVKAAEKISNHMLMGVSGDTFYMEAKGDTDQVRLEMSRDQLIDLKSGEDELPLFPGLSDRYSQDHK